MTWICAPAQRQVRQWTPTVVRRVQLDSDNDGVTNDLDLCPGRRQARQWTPTVVRRISWTADNDGVTNDLELCPGTPAGATVDANGCAPRLVGQGQ